MQVILTQDVKSLGKKGDVVKVSEGYARNFILPKKLGIEATSANLNDVKLKKANDDKVAKENLEKALALGKKIEEGQVTVGIKAGSNGHSFGSVSNKEIAEALKSQMGIEVDRKKIVIPSPIKSEGRFEVRVKLHAKVAAKLAVVVEAK